MNEINKTRMLLTTVALAAVAACFAGGANARLLDVDGGTGTGAATIQSGEPQQLTGVHAALERNRTETQVSLGLTGDSALTRASAPELVGLTGDSAATRYLGTAAPATSGGDDVDWTSFGVGAGAAALLAAAIAGIFLTTRRRGGVALP